MYGPHHLYFEDVDVGQTWESPPRELTANDIRAFAKLSGDFNPIHVDEAYAATTPFGRTIAHGLLILAHGSGLSVDHPPMRTIAVVELRTIRFLEPVYPGDALRIRTTILEKGRKGRGKRGQITWQRQMINQDNRTVQDGISVTIVEAREHAKI